MTIDLTEPHIVIHRHTQRCSHCGCTEAYSNVFECQTVGRARKLLPVTHSIIGTMPVVPVIMPTKLIPLCGACAETVPVPDAEALSRWSETLRRKALVPKTVQDLAPRTQTIDDLE